MKGIQMIEPLFNKTLQGVKTETRRIGSFKKMPDNNYLIGRVMGKTYPSLVTGAVVDNDGNEYKPRYKLGDFVYIKEPYFGSEGGDTVYKYATAAAVTNTNTLWANKMFMAQRYLRVVIEVTDVYAELLTDITEAAAEREGVEKYSFTEHNAPTYKQGYFKTFAEINGGVDTGQYVWVYTYKLIFSDVTGFEKRDINGINTNAELWQLCAEKVIKTFINANN